MAADGQRYASPDASICEARASACVSMHSRIFGAALGASEPPGLRLRSSMIAQAQRIYRTFLGRAAQVPFLLSSLPGLWLRGLPVQSRLVAHELQDFVPECLSVRTGMSRCVAGGTESGPLVPRAKGIAFGFFICSELARADLAPPS